MLPCRHLRLPTISYITPIEELILMSRLLILLLLIPLPVFAEEEPYPYSEMNLEIVLSQDHNFYVRDYQQASYFKPWETDYFSPKFMKFNKRRPETVVLQALMAISRGDKDKYSDLFFSQSEIAQQPYKKWQGLLKNSAVKFHKLGYYGHKSNGGEFAIVQLKALSANGAEDLGKIKFFLISTDHKWSLYSPDKNHMLHQLDFDNNPTCLARNEDGSLSKCLKHHQPPIEKKDLKK